MTCELHFLGDELKHLDTSLQANGHSVTEIRKAMQMRKSYQLTSAEDQAEAGAAFLPYINRLTDRRGKLLQRHEMKAIM